MKNPAWFQIVCGIVSVPWIWKTAALIALAVAAYLIGRLSQ